PAARESADPASAPVPISLATNGRAGCRERLCRDRVTAMKHSSTLASILLLVAPLGMAQSSYQVERDDRPMPDLIVSSLRKDGEDLVLEIQNQGNAAAYGRITANLRTNPMSNGRGETSFDIFLDAPGSFRAVTSQRIPLTRFGIPVGGEFSMIVNVALDTTNVV